MKPLNTHFYMLCLSITFLQLLFPEVPKQIICLHLSLRLLYCYTTFCMSSFTTFMNHLWSLPHSWQLHLQHPLLGDKQRSEATE